MMQTIDAREYQLLADAIRIAEALVATSANLRTALRREQELGSFSGAETTGGSQQ